MNSYSYKLTLLLLLLSFGSTILSADSYAQKKTRTRIKAYYEKISNGDRKISVEMISGSGKSMAPVPSSEVLLKIMNENDDPIEATIITNTEGSAYFIIQKGFMLPIDEEGFTHINVLYAGNDTLRSSSKDLSFMDLNLDLDFAIIDSVKQLNIFAYQLDANGTKIPVPEISVNIGVQRLYSILTLEKLESNKKGKAKLAFPDDLPGDSTGSIIVIAKILDDDNFGSLTKSETVNWGTIVDYSTPPNGRSLFGDEAPMWMIIAVFVILAGAWFHFMLALVKVYQMYRLKNESSIQAEPEI